MKRKSFGVRGLLIGAAVLTLCLLSVFSVGANSGELLFAEGSGLSTKADLYVTGLPPKSPASAVTSRLTDPSGVDLRDLNGVSCAAGDIVGTGYQLSRMRYGVSGKTLTVVIRGDVSGDGDVTGSDYIRIKKNLSGGLPLEGAWFEAADVSGDNKISSSDYLAIKRYLSGSRPLHTPLPSFTPTVPAQPTENPYSLGDSVQYADLVKNRIKNYYETPERQAYVIENAGMKLAQGVIGEGTKNVRSFTNKDGGVYFQNTFEPFLQAEGGRLSYLRDGRDAGAEGSQTNLRHGSYFYETHFRYIDFTGYGNTRMDLIYNTLPDSLRVTNRLIVDQAPSTNKNYTLGNELKIAKANVRAFRIADKDGVHTDLSGYDASSVSYVAFDIKKAGVVGIIYAADCTCESVSVTLEDGMYVIRSTRVLKNISAGQEYLMTLRLYNDTTHSFTGIEEAAYLERNPAALTVNSTQNVKKLGAVGYDSDKGMYRISATLNNIVNPTASTTNRYSEFNLTVQNDGHARPVYIYINGSAGMLACSVVRDASGAVVAIPTEVCKNFTGDDTAYDAADTGYGDTIFPLYAKPSESLTCIPTKLWINWGQAPLSQISSIQYYFMYLHMSTNTTETTCFVPFGGGAKDGKIVADFRGCSGNIWESQPQFNHAGNFYFVSKNTHRMDSEFTGDLDIISSGPTYAKMKLSFLADSGDYRYSVTHMQFPQNDETRNYYTLELTFLKDTEFTNARQQLQLFSYNNSMGSYRNVAYLDEDGTVKEKKATNMYCSLAPGGSFFTFYTNANKDTENMAVIVRDFDVTVEGGQKWNGNLSACALSDFSMCLALNTRKISFCAGDTIRVNFVLLPYGDALQENYDNVLRVFADTVENPMTVSAAVGTVASDPYMAVINAQEDRAEFTVSGSANYNTIRVNGFQADTKPIIEEQRGGSWVSYDNAVKGFDGYAAHYNEDGTYGFSFVVDMGTDGAARTFRIRQA